MKSELLEAFIDTLLGRHTHPEAARLKHQNIK
jgi:hypothetical protein